MLIEFPSLEQTKVSIYFHIHKTGLVMELLRFVPRFFFQIYTIHEQINGHIPPVFTLCSQTKLKKLIPDYSEKLNNSVANSPTDILMDFERAALNSVGQVYPNTEFKGCFYHFSSNIWKHI